MWPSGVDSLSCDILGGHTDIVTRCAVTRGNDNVTIQWYFSSSEENAGRNGDILYGNSDNQDRISVLHHCTLAVCIAQLTIRNAGLQDVGYYWCRLAESTSGGGTLVRNPSSFLHMSGSCTELAPCTESNPLSIPPYYQSCAYGSEMEDDTSTVSLQNCTGLIGDGMTTTNSEMQGTTGAITSDSLTANITSDGPPTPTTPDSQGTESTTARTTALPPTTVNKGTGEPGMTDVASVDNLLPTGNEGTNGLIMTDATSVGIPTTKSMSTLTDLLNVVNTEANSVVWPIAGAGMGVLVFIIGILLVVIVCLLCIRRKRKGTCTYSHLYYSTQPHQTLQTL